MKPRISQRQPLACQECTKRKRKCDKQLPCSRCQRLKLDCAREAVQVRRRIDVEKDFLLSIKSDLEGQRKSRISDVLEKITERLKLLGADSLTATLDQNDTELEDRPSLSAANSHVEPATDSREVSMVTAIEHLAWGRSYGSCYPHRHCTCQFHENWNNAALDTSFNLADSPMSTTVNLPDIRTAKLLVDFHLDRIAWHHNSLHCPSFKDQCEKFWATGRCSSSQWIALYCSVLSTAIYCLLNSAQSLFTTMVNVLYLSDFLQDLSIYSVQAIVISTEVAHNLGMSQLNATLFSSAIRIAECLGLHKILDAPMQAVYNEDSWLEAVEKEVGKRVWCQMLIQDHFAIPFTDSYAINPSQYSTNLPRNADDHDLKHMPDSVPTISTYTRVLAMIAQIMPELANGLGPLRARKPTDEQYKHILLIDQKMRQLVRTIPKFLLQRDEILESTLPWLTIARQSLAVTSAEKIIMIHRPFIFQSFNSNIYAHTRRTCISAAITILREHETIVQAGELSLWTHTAFAITAAVILCFEIKAGYEANTTENPKAATYRSLIQATRDRLLQRTNDVLASRGIMLINAMMPEIDITGHLLGVQSGPMCTNKGIDFREIVQRFRWDDAFSVATGQPYSDTTCLMDAQQGVEYDLFQAPNQDFEQWFMEIFSTAHWPVPDHNLRGID